MATDAAAGSDEPFFVVGCPRSGTTLVREILDSHPRLAVVDESHFVIGLAPRWWRRRRRLTVDDVMTHPRSHRLDVDPDRFRAELERVAPLPEAYPDAVDAVLSAYARCRGRLRWGDKTPGYVSYVDTLAAWFPDARFIHVVRDGRDVAASLAERPWGSRTAVSGAFWWVRKVRKATRDGSRLPEGRFLEVRLEDLTAEPRHWVERMCSHLGEAYDPRMLDYHARIANEGRERPLQERHLSRPPTPGLRDWQANLDRRTVAAVEAVCRRTLERHGYEPGRWSLAAWLYAYLVRVRDLVAVARPAIRTRLRPERREF